MDVHAALGPALTRMLFLSISNVMDTHGLYASERAEGHHPKRNVAQPFRQPKTDWALWSRP